MIMTPIAVYFLYFTFLYPESHLCRPQERTLASPSGKFEPSCVIYEGAECSSPTGFCQKTIRDLKRPCSDSSIIGYIPGKCDDLAISHLCTGDRSKVTKSDKYDPSCAYTFTNRMRGRKVNTKTSFNGPSSCSSDETVFYVSGKCETIDSPTICKKNNREMKKSSKIQTPSCAYYTGGDCAETVCQTTIEEGRSPCFDSTVLFYIPDACKVPRMKHNEDNLPVQEVKTVLKRKGSIIYEEILPSEEKLNISAKGPEELPVQKSEAAIVHLSIPVIPEGALPFETSSNTQELNIPEIVVQTESFVEDNEASMLVENSDDEPQKGDSMKLIGARLLASEANKEN